MSIAAHHKAVRGLRCVVSGHPVVTLHHCKGGSMVDLLGDAANPGVARKVSDWLVIPLHADYHIGNFGIDRGMGFYAVKRNWEAAFGSQVEHLLTVCRALEVNVFERAGFTVSLGGLCNAD